MENNKSKISEYLDSLQIKLSDRKVVTRPVSHIINYPIALGQCFYLLDFKIKKVTFQKGIKEFLGYEPHEFTFELASTYFHPEDRDMVERLMRATLMFASENNVSKDVAFFLTYRIRKKDNTYVKVLRQSTTFDLDEEGKIISNLSMLSDISFLNTANKVEWKFDAPGLDKEEFRKYVTKEYKGFFSERETEIIHLVDKGWSSKQIAEKLFLSKHTVDTHRRKILNKAHCKNAVELINFCKHNGIL